MASSSNGIVPPAAQGGGLPRPSVGAVLGLMLLVGGITAAAHWPVLSAGALSLDDQQFLTDNPLIRNPSWSSVERFFGEVLRPSTVQGYYLPLSMVSLMLDYAMGGRPEALGPFHRTSLTLHVLNTLLIVALLYALFHRPLPAALVGLLFGVHPLTVEPVAWVGERKTLLATCFALSALLAYVRHTRCGGHRWLAAALVLYALALLSKPTAAPLPLLLIVLDYWPLERLTVRGLVEKVPFFAVGGVFAVITLISHAPKAGMIASTPGAAGRGPLMICHLLVFYLHKLLWPTGLSSIYPPPEPLSLANPTILLGILGAGLLAVVLVGSVRRTRALLAGGLFFVIALCPTLGVVHYSWVTASDKYVYLPMIGLCMTLAGLGGHVWARAGFVRPVRVLLVVAAGGLAAAEIRAVRNYLPYWRDSVTLAQRMVALAPTAAAAHHQLGYALASAGQVDSARSEFRCALDLQPGYPDASYNLGVALCLAGQFAEAETLLARVVHLPPESARAHDYLGLALRGQERTSEATLQFERALQIDSEDPLAHYSMGQVLQSQGRIDEAIAHFQQTLRVTPDVPDAHNNLGSALVVQRQYDEAIRHFRLALQSDPNHADALCNLASVLATRGEFDEAVEHLRHALSIKPNHAEAHYNLGLALQRRGRGDEAIDHYRHALELRPDYVEAHNGLGTILALSNRFPEALAHFRDALCLRPDWLPPLNGAAWILATDADPAVRQDNEAVRLAERACALTQRRDPGVLDTLAAAYASAGRFDEAVSTAQEAVALAASRKSDGLAAVIAQRLELYRQGRPYREAAAPSPSSAPAE